MDEDAFLQKFGPALANYRPGIRRACTGKEYAHAFSEEIFEGLKGRFFDIRTTALPSQWPYVRFDTLCISMIYIPPDQPPFLREESGAMILLCVFWHPGIFVSIMSLRNAFKQYASMLCYVSTFAKKKKIVAV
jgi:hypothetical protein